MEHEKRTIKDKVNESRSSDRRLHEDNSPRGTGAQKRSQKQKRDPKTGQTCVKDSSLSDRSSAVVSPYSSAHKVKTPKASGSSRRPAEVQMGVPQCPGPQMLPQQQRNSRQADEQLQLKDQRLRERDEQTRIITQTQGTLQESKHKVKKLEKNLELSKGHIERLPASKQKKTDAPQQDIKPPQEKNDKLKSQKPKKTDRMEAIRRIYRNPVVPEASKKKKAVVDSTRGRGARERDSGAVQTKDSNLHLDTLSTIPEVVNDGEFFSNEKAKEQEEGAQMVEMKEQESKIPADQVRSEESPAQELAKEKRKSSNIIKKLFGFCMHK